MMREFFQARSVLAKVIAVVLIYGVCGAVLHLVASYTKPDRLWTILLVVAGWLAMRPWLPKPLLPGTMQWEVFVRAQPETVWDAYHPHVRQAQYSYLLSPQMGFLEVPTIGTERFTVYDNPRHFVTEIDFELYGERQTGRVEGWLEPAPGGTKFKLAI